MRVAGKEALAESDHGWGKKSAGYPALFSNSI